MEGDNKNQVEVPRNRLEESLVRIWQDILKTKHIGISDNFFEIGGNSIKGLLLLLKLNIDYEIALKDIFESPTVSQLAGKIRPGLHKALQ
ncbi:MAG: hypothetical protein GY757_61815 [bacterium]|nr:hypothetical protein [bacterium]